MKAWLELQGFEAPFLDFDKHIGLAPGVDWEQTLYREIEQSQALLIIQSANWSASKWCFVEFTQARALGKPIFQVIETANGDAGPPIAPHLQVLDLRQEREAGLHQLHQQLAEIALNSQGGFPWDATRPAYPGLLAFEEEDAPIYFGRDDEIRHLIERLNARRTLGGCRLLVLLGASGSGKSSLLRAGVCPRLRRAGRGWLVVPPFRPQSQPCQELARALALAGGRGSEWRDLHRSLLDGDRSGTLSAALAEIASDLRMAAGANEAQILLSIDQAEELFSGLEPEEAHRFFRILSAAMTGDLPFLAVMTLRSEFLSRLQAAEKDSLTARFEEMSLAPMAMAQIPAIIKGPARVANVAVDEAFVQQATADSETEDALPLLAFALRELYERFGGDRHLSLADYLALGDARSALSPLENAVRRRADEVIAEMKPSEQQKKALRDAFVPAMVRFEQGNYVRRPAQWDLLPTEARPLLEKFVSARLLISHEQEGTRELEVTHEALLRKWPLLRGWLDEDREFLIGSQQLELDFQYWSQAGESDRPAALLSGLKLHRAKAWLSERPHQLSDALRDFVQASSDRVEAQKRRARRFRRLVMVGLSCLSALAVTGGGIAWWREGQARAAEYSAHAEVLKRSDPLASIVYGLAAIDHLTEAEAFHTSQTLSYATSRNFQIASIPTGQGAVWSLIELKNGDLISAGRDGTLRRWRDWKAVSNAIPTNQGLLTALIELQNGELISAGKDGTLRRWRDGKAVGQAIPTGQGAVWSLIELKNGELISAGKDGTLQRWRDGKAMGQAIPTGQGEVWSLSELRNGDLISAGKDGTLVQWRNNMTAVTVIPTGQGSVQSLIQLKNGDLISAGDDGNLRRWRAGKAVGEEIPTGQGAVSSLIQLKNGDLISSGFDGTLRRWRNSMTVVTVIHTGQGAVWRLIKLKNGDLISSGSNGTLRRWRDGKAVGQAIPTGQGVLSSLIQLNNGDLISAGEDGTLRRWRDGKAVGEEIPTGQGVLSSLIQLNNGDLISAGENGTLRRWRDGKAVGQAIPTGQGAVWRLIQLKNGELISAGEDGTLRRWRDGKAVGQAIPTGQGAVTELIELQNGVLVSAGNDGSLRRWRDGKAVGEASPTGQGAVWKLIELKNGDLISAGQDGSLRRLISPGVAIEEACKELQEHPVLLSPKNPPEQAARTTCLNHGLLKG